VVVRDGRLVTADEEAIVGDARRVARRIVQGSSGP